MQLEEQLKLANCTFPFEHLGLHANDTGFTITAWVPGALSIAVIDAKNGNTIGNLAHITGTSLFKARFENQPAPVVYRLRISTAETEYETYDPISLRSRPTMRCIL